MTTWWEELYASVDAMDLGFVDRLCTPDTTVRFANHEPDVGRDAVKAALAGFWATIAAMQHSFVHVIDGGDRAVIEASVRYTRHDGTSVAIPVATVIEREDGLISAQRVYIDLTPLHSD